MSFQRFLAGVECEEEEDDENGAEDGEDDHPNHHVHCTVRPLVVIGLLGELVGLVHEVAQRPAK